MSNYNSNSQHIVVQIIFNNKFQLLILNMIDNDNEGIRTHSIKFLEEVVLLQSSSASQGTSEDFSIDSLPNDLPFLNTKAVEDESE